MLKPARFYSNYFILILFSLSLALPAQSAFSEDLSSHSFSLAKNQTDESSSSKGEASFFKLEQDIVTSASKYAQDIIEAPSAISVITQEDIHQSGTFDITELFRFVPGTMVLEQDSLGRDVIIRGFPQEFSPRLLVLLDGVPVYTPLFSGVTWSFLPLSLPSIQRIEIIRGASSTLYGANAFSGVINIITKKPGDKPSMYIYGSGGNLGLTQEEAVFNGGNDKLKFRLSGMFRHDNGYGSNNGSGQFDGQNAGQGTIDFDWKVSKKTDMHFYLWGKGAQRQEPFTGFLGPQNLTFQNFYTGFKVAHQINDKQNLSFQATGYDLNQRDYTTNPANQTRREVNTDLQYNNQLSKRDTLVSGASFRTGGYRFINFTPPGLQDLTLASVFVNNDFKIRDNLILTTGGRYEYDSFTKSQFSGRGNLTYSPFKDQAFRVSIARAVRTPSVIEERLNLIGVPVQGIAPSPPFPPGTPTLVTALGGGASLKPESVIAGEFGYVGRFFDNKFNANLQFYYNRVYNFITVGLQNFNPLVSPPQANFNFANRGNGSVYGLELELGGSPVKWWKTSFNYTFTQQNGFQTGIFPETLLNFKNRFMFKGFSAELLFNYTSPYTAFDIFTATSNPIGNIFRLDARLAQKFYKDRFEVSVVGQNLIDSPHSEFSPAIQVNRLIYGVLSFTY